MTGLGVMVDLPESSGTYPSGIRQIDSGETAFGGDTTKPPNEQLLALASRTAFLKAQLDAIQTEIDGLTIGEEVQAHSSVLDALAALAADASVLIGRDGTAAVVNIPQSTFQASNSNLDALAGLSLVANKLLGTNGAGALALLNKVSVAVLQDYKASFAGTGSTGSWLKRDLNNIEEAGQSFCSLNGDSTFDLNAGGYLLIARVPATMVDKHQARLFNVTDNSFFKGSSTQTLNAAAVSGQSITTDSWVFAAFSETSTKKFQIEQRIYDTITDRSLGAEVGTGLGEVYTQVVIVKLS